MRHHFSLLLQHESTQYLKRATFKTHQKSHKITQIQIKSIKTSNYKPGIEEDEEIGGENRRKVEFCWREVGFKGEFLGFVARKEEWQAAKEAIGKDGIFYFDFDFESVTV